MHVPTGWAPPPGRLARLRGVRAAGWMGRMPAAGGVWTALGLWRGVMEVSVVGIGSVNLTNKKKNILLFVLMIANSTRARKHRLRPKNSCLGFAWLFFAAAASLALTGSGSFRGIGEFYIKDKIQRITFLQQRDVSKHVATQSCSNQLVGQAENV